MAEPVRFEADVYKIQTLRDGGARVTLDLPESEMAEAAALMALVGEVVVRVTVEVVRDEQTES